MSQLPLRHSVRLARTSVFTRFLLLMFQFYALSMVSAYCKKRQIQSLPITLELGRHASLQGGQTRHKALRRAFQAQHAQRAHEHVQTIERCLGHLAGAF